MKDNQPENYPGAKALRRPHSNCGVGVLMDLRGRKSHQIVSDALKILCNLDHRGARGAEENTGDGAGILVQKPHRFFKNQMPFLPDPDRYGVGQFFFPKESELHPALMDLIEELCAQERFKVLAWRDVPTHDADLGRTALESEPAVKQLFVEPNGDENTEQLPVRFYLLRRVIESAVAASDLPGREDFYVCSLNRRKIVYKGLLTNEQVGLYYPDLRNPLFESSLALVHSRFSTNTLGAWRLAHPYRSIVHNGEINTYRGNYNWMRAREADLASPLFGDQIDKIKPVTTDTQSDTAMLDNVLELVVVAGRSVEHALRMLIPEAWNKDPLISPQKRDWYDYHGTLVEPWDGPALVAFTDGDSVGAVLDRNGFRPCRYSITRDHRLIMASESGVLDVDPEDVLEKGRLKPGQMFLADAREGRILSDDEVFERLTDHQYGEWLKENRVRLPDLVSSRSPTPVPALQHELISLQSAFGYTLESLSRLVRPMAEDGKDPVGAMGDDTPLAVLSERTRPLYSYFKQLFAQVSNPPIDYIREDLVTSLESHIGRQGNFLTEEDGDCRRVYLRSPILDHAEMAALSELDVNGIKSKTLDSTFEIGSSLGEALARLQSDAEQAARDGFEILIVSDRAAGPGRLPIPALLATGALHHHLIRCGLRTRTSLVLEAGEPSAVHHFCCLIGYGADAIHPYLAYESIRKLLHCRNGDWEEAVRRYIAAVEDGILKVMSKMGISTLESYKGAQIFEAVGLESALVDEYFTGTVSRIGGIGLEEIENDARAWHRRGFEPLPEGNLRLDQGGEFYWRRDGEFHHWNPETVGTLQYAVRSGGQGAYDRFSAMAHDEDGRLQNLRSLLDFNLEKGKPIDLSEVESAEEIFKRFFTGSMSLGALSQEAHETLAVAMNRIGAKASSGEGGEQRDRFGTERECKNKQVASGRFGVTGHYLAHAEQIEIKMAQGAKPGEGGQLPGEKVDEMIAGVRFTTPGVGLISPPPHHDIYSIEDLAQLIHDLKCANPKAEIHVKLVSVAGVGTIAAGVSKARADSILIAGDGGGTGAAAKTSIKSAGLPWELGLSEAHQLLVENRLRSRVRLRVDGGFRTGRDVVVAALLGAEEYGFGTSALVALGCIMLRKCHCNTCSVGVATQDPELRKRFPGKPEHVIRYMYFIAEEVRQWMARLGFRTMEEMIGHSDRLNQRQVPGSRAAKVDLSAVLYRPAPLDEPRKTREQNHKLEAKLDHRLIQEAEPALTKGEHVRIHLPITNHDRTFGTMLGWRVVNKYGLEGLPEDTIEIFLRGTAGQSLGAFLSHGISIHLTGEANDYVGKGLSGGKIFITTPEEAAYTADRNIIAGNVTLYGATAGQLHLNGIVGERFAVRNSGALAVVEGVGNHGCEYMTGGVVVILGEVGRNFAAGMSGGEAYIYREDNFAEENINREMVDLRELDRDRDPRLLHRMVENHWKRVRSSKARRILDDWDQELSRFIKVMPKAYDAVIRRNLEKGRDIRVPIPGPVRDHRPHEYVEEAEI